VAPPDQPVALAPDTAIGIIFDTSGSMRKRLEGKRRINIAKDSLRELLGRTIAEGTPVAIRTLGPGNKQWKCRSRLELPLAPLDRAEALRWVKQVSAPIETTLNIVGFALDDEALKAEMAAWAAAGNGRYFDAASGDELGAAITTAVSAPFEVYAVDGGAPVAEGTVVGEAVEVPPGEYTVAVPSDTLVELSEIVVEPGAVVSVELPGAEAAE